MQIADREVTLDTIRRASGRVITLVKALIEKPPPCDQSHWPIVGNLVTFQLRGKAQYAIVTEIAARKTDGLRHARLMYITAAALEAARKRYHVDAIDPREVDAPSQAADRARGGLPVGASQRARNEAYSAAYTDMLIRHRIARTLPHLYWAARVEPAHAVRPLVELTIVHENQGV